MIAAWGILFATALGNIVAAVDNLVYDPNVEKINNKAGVEEESYILPIRPVDITDVPKEDEDHIPKKAAYMEEPYVTPIRPTDVPQDAMIHMVADYAADGKVETKWNKDVILEPIENMEDRMPLPPLPIRMPPPLKEKIQSHWDEDKMINEPMIGPFDRPTEPAWTKETFKTPEKWKKTYGWNKKEKKRKKQSWNLFSSNERNPRKFPPRYRAVDHHHQHGYHHENQPRITRCGTPEISLRQRDDGHRHHHHRHHHHRHHHHRHHHHMHQAIFGLSILFFAAWGFTRMLCLCFRTCASKPHRRHFATQSSNMYSSHHTATAPPAPAYSEYPATQSPYYAPLQSEPHYV